MTAATISRAAAANVPQTISGLQLHLDARQPINYDCLHLPGAGGYYASTPDSAALSITGDIDIRANIVPASWTPAAAQALVYKWDTAGHRSYSLYLDITGKLVWNFTVDGSTGKTAVSSAAVTPTANPLWVRATFAVATGATNFYTSPDGATWTGLGTQQTISGSPFTIADTDAVLAIGTQSGGVSNPFAGRVYRAQIRNGINGTIVFDADFTGRGSTFTEDSSNHATVTVNGRTPPTDGASTPIWADLSGNGRDVVQATATKRPLWKSAGPYVLFDGTDDYLAVVASVAQPCTVYVIAKLAANTQTSTYVGSAATAFLGATTTAFETYGGTALTTGTADTNAHVIEGVFNGASSVIAMDGTAATGAGGATGFTALNVGAIGGTSQFLKGSLAIVLVFKGAHDSGTRKRVERWLGQRYAIAVAQ